MKQDLNFILDGIDAADAEALLEGLTVGNVRADAADGLDMAKIRQKTMEKAGIRSRTRRVLRPWRRVMIVAAILALLVAALVGCATEVKLYGDAVTFFEIYDLSTEGLTRGEIKRIYRDIITRSFTYEKTAQVLEERVEGFKLPSQTLTAVEIAALWEKITASQESLTDSEIRYAWESVLDGNGNKIGSVFRQYEDDVLCWEISLNDYEIGNYWGYTVVEDGVIVNGSDPTSSSYDPRCVRLMMIDREGNVKWQTRLQDGGHREYFIKLLEESDGTYSVFSFADQTHLCVRRLDAEGNVPECRMIESDRWVQDVVRIESGYVVRINNDLTNEYARIVLYDSDWTVNGTYSYGEENRDYYVNSILEHNGRIYLSATAEPKREQRHRTAAYEYGCKWYGTLSWSGKRLTELVRKEQTALLLVCDPSSGKVESFYEVEESMGKGLSHNEQGELIWNVEQVVSAYFSPYTSSFSIGGKSAVFDYRFHADGRLLQQVKTEELAEFRQ